MSVYFYYDTLPKVTEFSSCYVCEMSNPQWRHLSPDEADEVERAFSDAILRQDDSERVKSLLGKVAKPDCTLCDGKGWYYRDTILPKINLANANAAAILSLMGYKDEDLYHGDVSISKFRRAYIKALNANPAKAVRPEHIEHGKPREIEPGVVDLKPIRMFSSELSEEDIKERLARIGQFLQEAIANKATRIYWN